MSEARTMEWRRALMVLAGILGVLGAMYFGGLWS